MDDRREDGAAWDDSLAAVKDVDITNDFMFSYVMRDPSICIEMLRLLLPDVKIREIRYLAEDGTELPPQPEPQKVLAEAFGQHGIRLDVYLDDGENVYNVEMQTTYPEALAKRTRYYQAQIDVSQLGRGFHYDKLRPCYLIFICKFDPFGMGLYRYAFENRCVEDPHLALDDGAHKLFFNTAGTRGEIGENLRNLLSYMNDTRAYPARETDGGLIHRLEKAVELAKMDKRWRRSYMTFEMKQRDAELRGEKRGIVIGEERGEKRGIVIGEERGIKIGEERGEKRAKIENAKRMLLKGCSVEMTSDCTELPLAEVIALSAQIAGQ